jgi:hypothetical protein
MDHFDSFRARPAGRQASSKGLSGGGGGQHGGRLADIDSEPCSVRTSHTGALTRQHSGAGSSGGGSSGGAGSGAGGSASCSAGASPRSARQQRQAGVRSSSGGGGDPPPEQARAELAAAAAVAMAAAAPAAAPRRPPQHQGPQQPGEPHGKARQLMSLQRDFSSLMGQFDSFQRRPSTGRR